jgi:class 3 adenylate cyclase
VHEAARVSASAGAGEIVASAATVDGMQGLTITDRRKLTLKGLADPVEVVWLDWRPADQPAASSQSLPPTEAR